MNILAFSASSSRHSINRDLVHYAARVLKSDIVPDAKFSYLDLNDFEMPIYSIDREREQGIPTAAHEFYSFIGAADAVLVSFAEHNGYVTSAWKNIHDWMRRINSKVWQGKPMVVLCATPGKRAGAGVLGILESQLPFFGGKVIGIFGIGSWDSAWNQVDQKLVQENDEANLLAALRQLGR